MEYIDINQSISELQARLEYLQRIKKQQEDRAKEKFIKMNDCDLNLSLIKNKSEEKERKINESTNFGLQYFNKPIGSKKYNEDMHVSLDAIYNLLNNMNKRITLLEKSVFY